MRKIYIADMDGTLLNSEGLVSQNSIEILNRLMDKGLLFSICTARSIVSAYHLIKDLKFNIPVVLMNGVFLYDIVNKKTIKHFPVENAAAKKAFEIYNRHGVHPFMYTFDGENLDLSFEELDNSSVRDFYESRKIHYHSCLQIPKLEIPENQDIVYFSTLNKYDKLKPLHDEMINVPGLKCAFYRDTYTEDDWFFETFTSSAGKGVGIKSLGEYTKAEKLIVFGDNYNDIPMFEAADEAYAMGNAIEEIKQMATAVILSNDQDGVAKFIEERFNCG